MRSAPGVSVADVTVAGHPSVMVAGLSDAAVLAALDAAFQVRREADATIVRLTGEITDRSRSSLGAEGLASRLGETSPAAVVTSVGRIGMAEARRFCRLGDATRARMSLVGEVMPPMFPAVAVSLAAGQLGVDAASHIVTALGQATPRASIEDLVLAEEALVQFAESSPADLVRALAGRYRDALDADGVEPREDELIAGRSLRRMLLPNGLKRFQLDLDPLSAAHLDASIDLARHPNICTNTQVPTPSVTVIVRIPLDSLLSGLGSASIDRCEHPISATTARLLAADAHLIQIALGGHGETLDLGRSRRLFTRPQRLALAKRDGGRAFPTSDRPPTWTEEHHMVVVP